MTETDKKRAEDFKKELVELLTKYKAEINLEEEGGWGYMRGLDRMIVCFEAQWDDDFDLVHSCQELDLGRYLSGE